MSAQHLELKAGSHASLVLVSKLDALTDEEQAWILRDEECWRRAHEIAAAHPGVDVGGVYRVLRNLEKTPTERLRNALTHGRLFSVHRR